MSFNFPLLRPVRMLLFPFSLVYLLVIFLRNKLYDKKILSESSFNLPVICVGNIAVGGTGKSPMVEYLVRQFKDEFQLATLSRGYKRKTSGYALAGPHSTALEIGDEPMQFHLKFPGVAIAVGEQRLEAIPQILQDRPGTQAVILDDAFQHRAIRAGLNIVLTDYNNLFTRDWYLPTGDLRDEKTSITRADIIVVTKCKKDLGPADREQIIGEIRPRPGQVVFFTSIQYGQPYHIITRDNLGITPDLEVLLVTGIANPRALKNYLAERSKTYYEMAYNDHHIFSIDDLREVMARFNSLSAHKKIILTTEKDAVRLVKFEQELRETPLYVLPIEQQFLFGGEDSFNQLVGNFIRNFSTHA